MATVEHRVLDAEDIERYQRSLDEYGNDVLRIITKDARRIPFSMNAAQRIVHKLLSDQMREHGHIRAIILKARQEGISTYTAARFFRRVTLYENQSALVIADERKRGQKLFKIYEEFDKRQPGWIAPAKQHARRGWNLHYDTALGEGLNSELNVETAKDEDIGRASTLQAVHASELAFWDNPEVAWTSLMQAVPDRGSEVIIESTANGVGNMFHQMWLDAEAGESDFIPIFLPWWIHEEYTVELTPSQKAELAETLNVDEQKMIEVGYELNGELHPLTIEQVAWRRMTIRNKLRGDESLFRQEYPATAREAFLVSGNCFFDEDALLEYENDTFEPTRYRLVWHRNGVQRSPAMRGHLRVWEDVKADGEYVIFVDTATGKKADKRESIYASDREQGGRDFSCAYVYEVNARAYVAEYHSKEPPEVFAEKVFALGYLYSYPNRRTKGRLPALLGVERNHKSGETVVDLLKRWDYPNLFRDRTLNRRLNRMTPAVGWVSTEAKRQVMIDDFSGLIREHALGIFDADLVRECFTFIRDDDGKAQAQEGCHDDRVIAAAGCIQMARHHYAPALSSGRTLVRRGGPVGHLVGEEASDGRKDTGGPEANGIRRGEPGEPRRQRAAVTSAGGR